MILVGTDKGLIHYKIDPNLKVLRHVENHFTGFSVSMVYSDERSGRWWIGLNHRHWGQKLHYTEDNGKTWNEATVPSFHGEKMPGGEPARLHRVWSMQHGGHQQPDLLWMGTDPGGLFKSEDSGRSWQLVDGLWHHPSREKEGQWFGAGSDHPFIHSIVLDPQDDNHLYIAVSCAGIFETSDGGEKWVPKNNGLKATYLPNPEVEVGHDPHRLLMSKADNRILWQQNHCGIYYSDNAGDLWQEVTGENGMPGYGFSLAIDEQDPAKAWVIPAESDAQRVAPDLKLRVFYTENFGKNWSSVSDGLPQKNAYDIILRQAFVKSGDLLVFGTTNGNLYNAYIEDMKWQLASFHLPKVNCIAII